MLDGLYVQIRDERADARPAELVAFSEGPLSQFAGHQSFKQPSMHGPERGQSQRSEVFAKDCF